MGDHVESWHPWAPPWWEEGEQTRGDEIVGVCGRWLLLLLFFFFLGEMEEFSAVSENEGESGLAGCEEKGGSMTYSVGK